MPGSLKKYNTLGCCGIDCGLCPRFYTQGDSACPGCGGADFKEKHPACGFLTCCAMKHKLEVCSECADYPCPRFDSEKKGYDSFVTHAKIFANHEFVQKHGVPGFIGRQKLRMKILQEWLAHDDDGRSKSFFCMACALLPLEPLQKIQKAAADFGGSLALKERNQQLKAELQLLAKKTKLELKLKNKK